MGQNAAFGGGGDQEGEELSADDGLERVEGRPQTIAAPVMSPAPATLLMRAISQVTAVPRLNP